MANCKINLEWIPNIYAENETTVPKKQTPKKAASIHPIVRSTGIYKSKKSRC
jgi:hypothetical protein